jgi:DNA-binding response OmpR family regulator
VPAEAILLVEDDEIIAATLSRALAAQGYEVTHVDRGVPAVAQASGADLVLLDLGLADLDGVEVCRRIRASDSEIPIVMLTARCEEIDVVIGLDAGAVDYVTKPFRLAELLARIRVHLRRPSAGSEPAVLTVGDVVVDLESRRVWCGGQEIELRAKEFDLLALLVRHAGKVVTREQLMCDVWDEHWFGSTKTLDVHLASLRRRLGEEPGQPSRIATLRGVGYRYELP